MRHGVGELVSFLSLLSMKKGQVREVKSFVGGYTANMQLMAELLGSMDSPWIYFQE